MSVSPKTMKFFLVVGASRGIGASVTQHLIEQGHSVVGVSRTKPPFGEWIQADVSTHDGISMVCEAIGDRPLDGFLYLGGVWEEGAFADAFSFENSSDAETRLVLSVNLIAPIELSRGIAKNLALTESPRAIFIGALSGLDHSATPEVANTASKFGLRGAVQALRLVYRRKKIGFTVINPGNVATLEVQKDIEEGRFPEQAPIPLDDLCKTIDWILSLSALTEVGDVNLIQKEG
ncbi:SDR family oxidoreductase [Synechococcus sp. L2F]|uniref:SDR family NAD(P)-dependent oxidoreductase n=1 Tax=Synechococcus sp. L2F TaxID=2823739 RepID=UPI0020CC0B86|nr:SDR family oxidoreductase [Synechococcus sp. L2F]MCP9827336.1 SDR family oxidoreductase [Synechococcus sp. L2F]